MQDNRLPFSATTTFEVLVRVDAARAVLDAVLLGGVWLDADVLTEVGGLLAAAARWQSVAEVEAA